MILTAAVLLQLLHTWTLQNKTCVFTELLAFVTFAFAQSSGFVHYAG